jgi:protein TonB
MRHSILLILPLLALACGRPSLDKADGSFDRAAFRDLHANQCAEQSQGIGMPEADANRICGCITDRLIASGSDDELRTWYRDDRVPASRIQAATEQCRHLGPGGSISSAADDEPPPPDEPPPSMADGTPPPLVAPPPGAPATPRAELADGPDAGTGASAPGGARARVTPLATYLTADDYPAAALRNNEQGRVTVILDVAPTGRVANCIVTETSGSAALDSTTCRIMRSRPRYTPARNPRGVAVADRDRAIVRWRLPSG